MANCGNGNEACARAPGSTVIEIHKTEPCVRAALWIWRMHICVRTHSCSRESTQRFMPPAPDVVSQFDVRTLASLCHWLLLWAHISPSAARGVAFNRTADFTRTWPQHNGPVTDFTRSCLLKEQQLACKPTFIFQLWCQDDFIPALYFSNCWNQSVSGLRTRGHLYKPLGSADYRWSGTSW